MRALVRSRLAVAILASVVSGLLVGGVAWAVISSPVDSNGVVHACINSSRQFLAPKTSSQACDTGETPVSWTQNGVDVATLCRVALAVNRVYSYALPTECAVRVPTLTAQISGSVVDDADHSGGLSQGDVVRWQLKVWNTSVNDAPGVRVRDGLDRIQLIDGSVTTSQGSIVTADPNLVEVDLGTVRASRRVDIAYNTRYIGTGAAPLTNSAVVTSTYFHDLRPASAPLAVQWDTIVSATKDVAVVEDADSSGGLTEGDRVRWTIRLQQGPLGPSDGVKVTDAAYQPPYNFVALNLISGTVTSTAGTVTRGNATGDIDVEVNVGTIVRGGAVVITFDTRAAWSTLGRFGQFHGLVNAATVTASIPPKSLTTSDPSPPTSGVCVDIATDLGSATCIAEGET